MPDKPISVSGILISSKTKHLLEQGQQGIWHNNNNPQPPENVSPNARSELIVQEEVSRRFHRSRADYTSPRVFSPKNITTS
jgi:hypothetical protein